MNSHLTPEQLFDLLSSTQNPAAPHLEDCPACREEFETLRGSLSTFRLAATAYAHRFSPTEAPARPILLTPARRFGRPVTWASGLAAAALLCTAGVTAAHRHSTRGVAVAVVQPARNAQKTSVSDEDAALLEGIDRDLSTSVPPSLQPLDVTSTSETTSTSNQN